MPHLVTERKTSHAASIDPVQLIRQIAQGDPESFAKLFVQFAPRVKRYMMLLNATPSLAEELSQETLLSVWRKASHFDPAQGTAEGWIFRIARNLRIDAARRQRAPDDGLAKPADPDEPSPETLLLSQERLTLVNAGLSHLTQNQQDVLRAALLRDRPLIQIANELGLPLSTTKSHLRRGIARLREILGESD